MRIMKKTRMIPTLLVHTAINDNHMNSEFPSVHVLKMWDSLPVAVTTCEKHLDPQIQSRYDRLAQSHLLHIINP